MTTLWAVSDLHAVVKRNRDRIDSIHPLEPSDWLIVAGDVAERTEQVVRELATLKRRFERVLWVPGNHELFARSQDRNKGRGKYEELVAALRKKGIDTPEDPYPVFGKVTVCPLFTFYDYSFRAPGTTIEEALQDAKNKQLLLTDEFTIAPYVDIRAWCWQRLEYSVRRLSNVDGETILINHWPLIREPTRYLRFPEIAMWCGTRHTQSWPTRYRARHVIYGHLHMPTSFTFEGVEHHEVSLGYPREWEYSHGLAQTPSFPRRIMSLEDNA